MIATVGVGSDLMLLCLARCACRPSHRSGTGGV